MGNLFEQIGQIVSGLGEVSARTFIDLAARLRAGGGRILPLILLKLIVGVQPRDLEDPARLHARVKRRLAKFDPGLTLACLWLLSNTLISDGHAATAATLLELEAGLEPELYEDPPALSARLEDYLGQFEPEARVAFLTGLGNALARAMRHADGLVLLETGLGLTPEDYGDRSRLNACLETHLGPRASEIKSFVSMLLASALVKAGRYTELVAVVEADLGIDEGEDDDPAQWREVVQSRWGSLDPRLAILQVTMSAAMLDVAERPRAATGLLEAGLGLTPADYQDRRNLEAKLRARFSGLPEDARIYTLQLLAGALVSADREEDGLALLAFMQGVETKDLGRLGRPDGKLREYQGSDKEAGDFYRLQALEILGQTAPGAATPAALDLARIFKTADWTDEGSLRLKLKREMDGKRLDLAAGYMVQMVSALEEREHEDRAALLLDIFHREYSPLRTLADEPFAAVALTPLYEKWLRFWGGDATRRPLEVCQELTTYLREMVLERGRVLRDREAFIRSLADLRRQIVQTGFYWVGREAKEGVALDLRRTVLLWDLELTQRLLLERLLRLEITLAPAAEPPEPGQWPLPVKERPVPRHYLPDGDTIQRSVGALDHVLTSGPQTLDEISAKGDLLGLAARFKSLVSDGVAEPVLAASLGGSLLLRVTFDSEGTLIWTGLEGDGVRLREMGYGSGAPGDLARLRWAATRHDFRLTWLHWNQDLRQGKVPILGDYIRGAIVEVLRATAEVFRPDFSTDVGPIQHFYRVFEDLAVKTGGWGAEPRLISLMAPLVRTIFTARELKSPESYIAWAEKVGAELREMEQSVREEEMEETLLEALDQATEEYLRQVAAIWDLGSLVPLLSPEKDLVVQVDDVLHSVPMAYLPVGGRPLHAQVRSLRDSLSPVLDTVLNGLEEEVRTRPRDPRLLSVSFFEPTDLARDGGSWLHHGHLHLAEIHTCECVAAADRPAGSLATIRGALERHGGFTVGSVCGHGDSLRAGVVLSGEDGAPRLWQGNGCDLSGIDWLLFVSCSIGRAAQTGDLDVEGFCAQLFAHRARAVAACRWPVLSVQAATFANEAVHQYLKLIAEEPHGSALRARALNLTRQCFSGRDGDRPLVGLNTAAAFELYGLG